MPTNHLIHEKSPYLLQHAHNPVDWHAWSDTAFAQARAEDKPIFLSVGYATCHWCHVMERESFEDAEAAAYLNETFICIKVDREERPDIDAVYMAACQMLTGRGGWPLSIFMTPDKTPFFAATYIPKRARFGQGGLIDLCKHVRNLWQSDRQRVTDSAVSVAEHLGKAFEFSGAEPVTEPILNHACAQLTQMFDGQYGGFEPAPKFPTPHRLMFLLRHHHRTGDAKALEMVRKTLSAMRRGGIWDHVGFGFHRYSTDSQWLLPHFEKMLYDQALLALVYLEGWQVTGDPVCARTAREIFTYVLRDMTSETGGFYAAEDADSEGEEGKFYIWTTNGLREVLGTEAAELWSGIFNFSPDGNFSDEATGQKSGVNIPHLTRAFADWAETLNTEPDELEARWEAARRKLFRARARRVHPLKDDKILTDWNGLMIAALAVGARVLDQPEYARAARKAARFIEERLTDKTGRLLHRFRDGESGIAAHADDYAFLIRGLLELYRTTFDPADLKRAAALQKQMLDDFWDSENGGFFLTAEGMRELPVRPREVYDGATPSANSVSLLNLLHLGRLTGDTGWDECAGELSRAFSGTVKSQPSAFTFFLMGGDFALAETQEIVIVGDPEADDTRQMIAGLNRHFSPRQVVLLRSPENGNTLASVAGFTGSLRPVDGKATAYVCTDFACSRPVTDAEALLRQVSRKHKI
ncbi:thioredoxin domain-containing protein [Desulfonema ishimotonii]|uniref:Thioredoxin domain-containing protein n=1 Tax=Desulfonema ishimotonii TaxID=45657 RepID=A0A401FXW3_9BACT|nr:thioredoxin domain-containing protein [Desulfonema ishimotonii]GBC61805.1 thioredoxin domain-containing protein [Desulfonema ishimotonii]